MIVRLLKKQSVLFLATLTLSCLPVWSATPDESSGQIVAGQARFTVITPECIRIEYSATGEFVDAPSYFAVKRNVRDTSSRIHVKNDDVTIDTSAIHLHYHNDGQPLSAANLQAQISGGDQPVTWKPGLTNSANLGGTERTLDKWDGARPISDGLLSRDGWFLLDDSSSVLFAGDWFNARPHGSGTDWYLFGYGRDYKAALKSLTAISGKVPLPRRYAFGAWYSRYWPYSSDDFHQIVKEYETHGFPLDVIVMDMDWHVITLKNPALESKVHAREVKNSKTKQIWTGYTWNKELIPDPAALLQWFHGQGLAVTLNDHPADGIQPHENSYTNFMSAMHASTSNLETIPFDAGNLNYLKTFDDYAHLPLEKEGVDFWWLDWQQDPKTRSIPELSNLNALNEFNFRQSERDDKRGISFSRWAGWGDQRHPIHFSGDASTSFQMLAAEVPFTSTAGNVGCFFWTHDIGGHMGGRNEESYARWCQFGAFSAALRSHSTRNATMDRRPWLYPQWAEDSMKISFQLRSRFFPYTYSSANETCDESIPLLRPMYLEFPKTEAAYHQPQQYFYGDNILVAPIAEAGTGPLRLGRQVVWFPKGTWFNFFSGESFAGEQEQLVAATINEFPLYVRGGVPVPMTAFVSRMSTTPLTNLFIRCYPGQDSKTGAFTLYEDDGISKQHEIGIFAKTPLTYSRKGNTITVNIAATVGTYAGQPANRAYVIELPFTQKADSAKVNGQTTIVDYDSAEHLNRIIVPDGSIRTANEIIVVAAEADQNTLRTEAFARRAGLSIPTSGTTLESLLQTALNSTTEQPLKDAILAAVGKGSFQKIESSTGYPDTKTPKNYPQL